MAAEWYYAKGNEKVGPISESQLKELAEAGKLLPTDKVWQKGMTGWQDARTVAALFPSDVPPPLPSGGSGGTSGLKGLLRNYIRQLWPNKLRFFSMCLLVLVGLTFLTFGFGALLHIMDIENSFLMPFFLCFLAADVLLVIVVLFYAGPSLNAYFAKEQRIVLLGNGAKNSVIVRNNCWEPIGSKTPSLLLFTDGGFLRSDGYSAKWKYDELLDAIAITPIGGGTPVSLPIVSLTSEELVLSVEGRTLHYKKGTTVTGERMAEIQAKQAEFAKNAALVAFSAVAAVGAVAVGVLAAGGGAGGRGGGDSSSGTTDLLGNKRKVCWNCHHYFDARRPTCSHCGEINR